MPKISFAGFKDPVRRPRYIIWIMVAVLVIAGVMIPMLGATSSYWFCSQICHKVQDDSIMAYQHSTHAKISCMACHMPVNANPVIFLLHKVEALGEIPPTVTNNFELPLNAESEVSLTMTPDKCTQCHSMENRVVTPSPGIKIDHAKHSEKAISCTICHNRIAHNENFDLVLKNPKTGEPNKKHTNFMKMTACYRCHGLEPGAPATGKCSACHTPGFDLKPPSHKEADFFPKKHAELALETDKEVKKTQVERGIGAVTGETKAEFEAAAKEEGAKKAEPLGEMLPPVGAINYCSTCHMDAFCLNCHGTPMPHSKEFKEPKDLKDPKGHPVAAKAIPDKCVMCHTKGNPQFCNECHHGTQIDYKFDPAQPWVQQHAKGVVKSGIKSCTAKCHTTKFCSDCHTQGKVFPSSHTQQFWTRPSSPTVTVYGSQPASATALHSLSAIQSTEQCEICHGPGGANAPFCAGCHKLEVPHSKDFKQFHGQTGRKTPAVCLNCHGWKELCSNCHHVGSSFTEPWINVHGRSVAQSGAGGCLEKCHKQVDFCQPCHTQRRVVPGSHKAPNFIKIPGAEVGTHAQLYKKDSTICTYCHAGDAKTLPNSPFCKGCHTVDIPHPTGYGLKDPAKPASKANGGGHVQDLTTNKVPRAACLKCHEVASCNQCHHKGSPPDQPWVFYHPNTVKASGATACFECHVETYCSNCHVNLAKRGLVR